MNLCARQRRRLREHRRLVEEGDRRSEALRAVNVAADAGEPYYVRFRTGELEAHADAAYLHYTPNETIGGVEFHFVPESATCRWSRTCRRRSCPGRSTCREFG